MIIYTEQRLVPTDVNMMVIRDTAEDGGYYYVHRLLYDQAVILYDMYGEDPSKLLLELTGSEESRVDIDYFLENTPAPLNILGCYLIFVKNVVEAYEDMVGAIHVISGQMHLRNSLKFPREMRNTPSFSLSIKEEYKVAWDRFFMTTMPYSDDMFRPQSISPMNGTATTTYSTGEFMTEEEQIASIEQALFDPNFDPFAVLDEPAEEEEEEAAPAQAPTPASTPTVSTPVYAPVSEPEPVKEPEPQKPLTGYAAIVGNLL